MDKNKPQQKTPAAPQKGQAIPGKQPQQQPQQQPKGPAQQPKRPGSNW